MNTLDNLNKLQTILSFCSEKGMNCPTKITCNNGNITFIWEDDSKKKSYTIHRNTEISNNILTSLYFAFQEFNKIKF